MSNLVESLKNAFSGESQANRRYLAFARKAKDEGLLQVAKLFRAAAHAETVHALNHLQVMGEIKTTKENVRTAISGETFEFRKMYPEYVNIAEQEDNSRAAWSFKVAREVEQIHANLFMKASAALEKGTGLEAVDYYVCGVCGNTVESEPPEKCPICAAPKTKFSKVELK